MKYENYFEDTFESIHDYRKIIFLIFLIQNDKNLIHESGLSEPDINRLSLEFKNILKEQLEEYLHYIKDQEESILEKFLNR